MTARAVTPTAELVLPAAAPRWQWLEERRNGITGTDIVKIVGATSYGNALDVYLSKRHGEDDRDNEPARWGRILEDPVAQEWARLHGARVRRAGLLRHRRHRHHLVTCDRLVVGQPAVLECKTTSAFRAEDWEDGIPTRVTIQTQWQLHVSGHRVAHIAALIGGQRLVSFEVARDDAVIAYLAEEADRVWQAVQDGIPPHVHPSQLTTESLNRLHPDRAGAVELPKDAVDWIARYREAAEAERAAKATKDEARLALVQMLGDAEAGTVAGRPVVTYAASRPSVEVPAANARALLADHPDIAALYVVEKPGTRRFSLKK